LIALFDRLPEGFNIFAKGKVDVVAMKEGYDNANQAVVSAEQTLEFARATRAGVVTGIDDFATQVIPALEGAFGVDSIEAEAAPRKAVSSHGGGTTNGGGALNTPVP